MAANMVAGDVRQAVANEGHTKATAGDGTSSPQWLAGIYILFCSIAILPFLLAATPPIVDFANHAARLHLSCHSADPAIAAMYRIRFGLIPNLAVDLVNAPLCGLVGPSMVLRLVITASLAGVFAGCWRLQKAISGQANVMLLFLPGMAMNIVTMTGYINFLAGLAITVNLLATLCIRRPTFSGRIVIGNLAGIVLFLSHIFALATGMVLVFGLMLGTGRLTIIRAIRASLTAAAMFALPLLALPFVSREGGAIELLPELKIRVLTAPILTRTFAVDLPVLLLLLATLYLVWRHHCIAVAPVMRRPLGMLALYVLLVPARMSGAVDIDLRSGVMLAWLLFAAFVVVNLGARATRWLAGVAAVPLLAHSALAAATWPRFAAEVHEIRDAFSGLPANARILTMRSYVAIDTASSTATLLPIVYSHLASYATIDRHVFNPLEFTGAGMQPMSSIGDYAAIDVGAGAPLPLFDAVQLAHPTPAIIRRAARMNTSYALNWPQNFDYVLVYEFDAARRPRLPLRLIKSGTFFKIYATGRHP